MLTNEDIQKIVDAHKQIFYTREEAVSKKDFNRLEESFNTLQTSVDGLAVLFKRYVEEQKIYVHKLSQIETWVKQAAVKLGVDYHP